MYAVNLTKDEVVILHDLMITEMGKAAPRLPKCTWQDDCTSCRLMTKMYNLWKAVQDGDLPQD